MSQISYEAIDRFITRVRKASVTGGKSINLTIEEATELTAAMAQILLVKLQNQAIPAKEEVQDITIHGGGF